MDLRQLRKKADITNLLSLQSGGGKLAGKNMCKAKRELPLSYQKAMHGK